MANASQHLQVLRRAGLVATRREGARVHYRPAGDDDVALSLSLREVAQARLGGVERAARDYLGGEVDANPGPLHPHRHHPGWNSRNRVSAKRGPGSPAPFNRG